MGAAVGIGAELALDPLHGHGEILLRPRPARRIDARRAAQRIDHQAGIVGQRRQLRLCAAASAFSSALAWKLSPVSAGSARPSSPPLTQSTVKGASSSAISRTLPGLWLAMTSRPPWKRRAMLSASPSAWRWMLDQYDAAACGPAPAWP